MLRRSLATLKAYTGYDPKGVFPHGVPKRTFPFRERLQTPAATPWTGYPHVTRKTIANPLIPPMHMMFPRSWIGLFLFTVIFDVYFGNSWLPFLKDADPSKPSHNFFGNTAGIPHNLMSANAGYVMPNEACLPREGDMRCRDH